MDQPCRMWYADSSERIAGSALGLACSWSLSRSALRLACSSAALSYTRMPYADCRADQRKSERLRLDRAPGLPFIIGLAIGSILVLD